MADSGASPLQDKTNSSRTASFEGYARVYGEVFSALLSRGWTAHAAVGETNAIAREAVRQWEKLA